MPTMLLLISMYLHSLSILSAVLVFLLFLAPDEVCRRCGGFIQARR